MDSVIDDTQLPDNGYTYKKISQEQVDLQGVHVQTVNGVEQPFGPATFSELQEQAYWLSPKRKAEGEPEGQPSAKEARTDEYGAPEMARHGGGLLSAVEDVEGRLSISRSQTPAAGPAEGREIFDVEELNGLPLPRATGLPDELGFRIIRRKGNANDIPNNRIIAPASIRWEDGEIGFSDSTNNPEKGATKARRREYLGKPNSHAMYYDRRSHGWYAHELEEDDFDEEKVKKYNLHPRMGIFLPNSSNEAELPRDPVPGDRPVVCVGPKGQIIHASRSIWGSRLDAGIGAVGRKMEIRSVLRDFCARESIPPEEIEPSREHREAHRISMLLDRGVNPDLIPAAEQQRPEDGDPPYTAGTRSGLTLRSGSPASSAPGMSTILEAASVLDAEEEAAESSRNARSQPHSRPYDAIRDVFTDNAPPSPPSARPVIADTYNLSLLAELSEDRQRIMDQPAQSAAPPSTEMSMLDPRLFSPPGPGNNPGMRGPEFSRPSDYPRANQLQPPNEFGPQSQWIRSQEHPPASVPTRSNDFLRTALNPQPSSYPPIAPAPPAPAHPAPPARGLSPPPQRIPFSNTGAAGGSLPALRPVRSLLDDQPPLPESQGSPPPMSRPAMVASNSGSYYPPAPPRPFHSGYSIVDQPQMPPRQPVLMPGQQHLPPPPPGPPAQSPAPYPMSPPSYLASSPPPMPGPPGHILQQSQPQPPPFGGAPAPAAAASPHTRGGSSSASSSRYRKLEPAPTPPHRMRYQQPLRTVPFDYREAIKHYSAVEAPPQQGPTHIRGWTHNNIRQVRDPGKGDNPAPEDPS